MSAQIATVESPDTLRLSQEAQSALRLQVGSRIAVTIEQDKVTLEPLQEDDSNCAFPAAADEPSEDRKREARARVAQIAQELRSMFAGEPSLEDEYFQTRDADKW
jgi:hypothetical protein